MLKKYWSGNVTKKSDAPGLQEGVFTWRDPIKIAQALKKSAERSKGKSATPFQAAMSMLNFYINRAGKNLDKTHKQILDKTKLELRKLFGKDQ